MDKYQFYRGYGIRFYRDAQTTAVDTYGFEIKAFRKRPEHEGLMLAKAYIERLPENTRRAVHTTIGVYANDSMEINGVVDANLEQHIKYNLEARPGRAFFVNGVCINNGYLTQEKIDYYESLFKSNSNYTAIKASNQYH